MQSKRFNKYLNKPFIFVQFNNSNFKVKAFYKKHKFGVLKFKINIYKIILWTYLS